MSFKTKNYGSNPFNYAGDPLDYPLEDLTDQSNTFGFKWPEFGSNNESSENVSEIKWSGNGANYIFNALLHSCMLFAVLGIIFKYGLAPLITSTFQSVLNNQFESVIRKPLNDNDQIRLAAHYSQEPIDRLINFYQKPEDGFETHNQWLFMTVWIIVIMLTIALIFVAITSYSLNTKIPFKDFLIINIFTLILVGIIEFGFGWFVGMKYIPVPPSTMTTTVIDSLKQTFNN